MIGFFTSTAATRRISYTNGTVCLKTNLGGYDILSSLQAHKHHHLVSFYTCFHTCSQTRNQLILSVAGIKYCKSDIEVALFLAEEEDGGGGLYG